MDSTRTLVTTIGRPNFVYKYDKFVEILKETLPVSVAFSWNESHLNPKNRINSLTLPSTWRIDGATMCGTRFFATPTSLLPDLPPLRIDVYIPDQSAHPSYLREVLDSSRSVPLRDGGTIANLGISRHLCLSLDSYCTRNPEFLSHYAQLPFGSRIVFEEIKADVTQMEIFTEAAHALERASLSLSSLHRSYQDAIPVENWPGTMDITSLRLIKQLHDSISVVRIVLTGEEVIFKSNTGDFNHLYHEMKALLTISPHPNIISRPLHLITKRSSFGGKEGVIGFTLPYYPLGSIRDKLPLRLPDPTPGYPGKSAIFRQSLKWAHQITSSLHHIYTSPTSQTFYSDLRPDNILLSASGDLILCDFEQRGNWYEWLPPEIRYCQYIENLRSHIPSSDPDYADRWTHLLSLPLPTTSAPKTNINANPPISKAKIHNIDPSTAVMAANVPWFTLPRPLQERAMVYTLGIFIYCLFEGLSNPRSNIMNAFPFEAPNDVEFPQFKRTPVVMREIIRRSTGTGVEWREGGKRVVRVGGRLIPEERGGKGDEENRKDVNADVEMKVLNTGMQWWEGELSKAGEFFGGAEWQNKRFGEDRPTLKELLEMIESIQVDVDKVGDSNLEHED